MYKLGHYGVALLVYAPLAFALLVAGYEVAALLGGAGMVVLSTLPDIDHQLPLVSHRGPTHSVLFALVVGGGVAGVVMVLAPPYLGVTGTPVAAAFGFGVGTLAVLAHLLGDVLTPMGIRPFWPVSNASFSLSVTRASSPVANYLLFALGVLAAAAALVGAGQIV